MSIEPVIRGYVVGPGQGVPDRESEVKASGRSTGRSLTVIEVTVDEGPPRHTHTREHESLYVFTGALYVECGEDRFEAGQGLVRLPAAQPAAHLPVHRRPGYRAVDRDTGWPGRVLRRAARHAQRQRRS